MTSLASVTLLVTVTFDPLSQCLRRGFLSQENRTEGCSKSSGLSFVSLHVTPDNERHQKFLCDDGHDGRQSPATDATLRRSPKVCETCAWRQSDGLPMAFYEGVPPASLICTTRTVYHSLSLDPRTFKPKPGPRGQIHAWGIYPVCLICMCGPKVLTICSSTRRQTIWEMRKIATSRLVSWIVTFGSFSFE